MDFLFSLSEFLVIILFPLLLWKTFEGVIDNKKHLFSYALFISFLLSMLLTKNTYFIYFNSYLLIFLFKDKKALFIGSTLIILFVYFNIYLLIQYVLLFLLYFIKKNKFNCFIFISIYFYTLNYYVNYYSFINYIFIIVIFFLLELYIYKIILKDNYYDL